MSVGRDGSGDEDALAGHVRTACACVGSDVTETEKLRMIACGGSVETCRATCSGDAQTHFWWL